MNILLASATAMEIVPFLEYLREKNDLDVDVLVTGVGMTATAYHLAKQTSLKRPGMIIQAGVAGCFDKKIKLGAVVVVDREAIADQGVVEEKKIKTVFDLGLAEKNLSPFTKGWMLNPHKELMEKTGLKKVPGVSVNQVTTGAKNIRMIVDRFSPSIESMEGAALHFSALQENIPFLQLRAISNYIGERNKKKWEMKLAITHLNKVLQAVVEEMI